MMPDQFLASIVALVLTSGVLLVHGFLDVKHRRVSNQTAYSSLLLAVIITLITGHLFNRLVLHVSAILFVMIVSLILFRIGSIGGADFKTLMIIAIMSPGIEFANWGLPVLEAVIGGGVEILVILVLGHLYSWRYKDLTLEETTEVNLLKKPPLLIFLLVGYLMVQILAFF